MTKSEAKAALSKLCEKLGAEFTIDDLAAAAISEGIYEDEIQNATLKTVKALIRHDIKQIKNERGENEFANVQVLDNETNRPRRTYIQLKFATIEQWTQVIGYHEKVAQYHAQKAENYRKRALDAGFEIPSQIQLDFKFEDDGEDS